MSTLYLNDVSRSIVEICGAKRASLGHHIYNLHSYMFTAQNLMTAILLRYPDFTCSFTQNGPTEDLIRRWPNIFDDSAARQDWGWKPEYNFARTIDALALYANSQQGLI